MSDDLVNRFIKDLCFVLGIDVPKVTHDFLDTVVFVNLRRSRFAALSRR